MSVGVYKKNEKREREHRSHSEEKYGTRQCTRLESKKPKMMKNSKKLYEEHGERLERIIELEHLKRM